MEAGNIRKITESRIKDFMVRLITEADDYTQKGFTDLHISPECLFKAIQKLYPEAEIDFSEMETNGWEGDTWVPITAGGVTFNIAYGAYYGDVGLQQI